MLGCLEISKTLPRVGFLSAVTPTDKVNPLIHGFAFCSFSHLGSAMTQKYSMENSRNKQFIIIILVIVVLFCSTGI
jgi:hypothetical protein